jgi:aromatic ring-opening dioxygenase catalytic subunit (LigB family)
MLLPRALLVPHWPTLLEDEFRRHRTPMLHALALEARRFQAEKPAVAVVLSASWESSGPFHVGQGRQHRTLTEDPVFGVESRYDCPGHPELARALVEAGAAAGVRVGPSDRGVDGGVAVPMHFLAPGRGVRVVPLSTAQRPADECRRWGAVLHRVLAARPERIGLVVGGMLSHATHAWNFRREVPEAAELDQAVLEALRTGRWEEIGPAVDKWSAKAHPEAALRHLEVLRGFLGGEVAGEVRAYESGPGMGAALASFPVPDGVSVARPEDLVEPEVVPARRAAPSYRPRPPKPARRTERRGRRPESGKRANQRPKRSEGPGRANERPRRSERIDSRGKAARANGRPRRSVGGKPSAGSRTPRARGPARGKRPARRPRG